MQGISYLFIWIVLLAIPIFSLWKRQWLVSAIYGVGIIIFLVSVLKNNEGWSDLADFATLLVVVIPIYIVATFIWVVGMIIKRKNSLPN